MHVSVTSLIYWYIFLTTVNIQETSEIVMVDKNVPPNHWYFYLFDTKIHAFKIFWQIQSNFNGSNTFRTMKNSSRQGQFEPVRVDKSAKSSGIITISLIFYNMKVCCVFSLESPH